MFNHMNWYKVFDDLKNDSRFFCIFFCSPIKKIGILLEVKTPLLDYQPITTLFKDVNVGKFNSAQNYSATEEILFVICKDCNVVSTHFKL